MTTDQLVAIALVAAAAASSVLTVFGLRRRQLPGGWGFALMSACLSIWALANAVQVVSENADVKRATVDVVYPAICVLTLGLWWCMTALARRPRMTARLWVLLAAPVPVTSVLTWANPGGVMFDELRIPDGSGPVTSTPGPWFVVHTVWAYSMIVGALAIFAITALRAPRRYRPQAVLMVAAVAGPLAANALGVTRLFDFGGHDPTPIVMLATIAGLAWGVRRLRLIDAQVGLLPVARDVVVEAMPDGVIVVDGLGRVLDMNPAAGELLGTSPDRAVGTPVSGLVGGWDVDPSRASWEYAERHGELTRFVEVTRRTIDGSDRRTPVVALIRDVTERRHAEAALAESARLSHHQSRHDPLTGIANRTLLFERLRETLPGATAGPALLILDLDGFKDLNDTFGHRAGDEALVELSARLTQGAGEGATVARLAGDEFAVLLETGDRDTAVAVAFRLLDAVRIPIPVDGTEIGLGGSIGVAIAPFHGAGPDDLVHAADVAMYHAKRNATGVAVYASSSDVRRPDRLLVRQELRQAIGAGHLEVHYQPQCTANGRLVGAEALVRWRHPDRGLLTPGDFLPLAEESDLVCDLTDVVLDLALRDAARWDAPGLGIRISVNISARDLRNPRLPERVRAALQRNGVDASALTLEVTENGLATTRDATSQLEELRADGVKVSLDDFGTGFAPLATLREMPVDEIKIDRSFVHGMDRQERDAALVGGLIRLGHDLGLSVVAEGVETHQAADQLDSLGCDVLQGYLLGRPQAIEDVAQMRPAMLSAAPRAASP